MVSSPQRRTLTLRQVAALAGVRPSAVSNWRKRNVGFPQPVGSAGREDQFDADEVENWLAATGRLNPSEQQAEARSLGPIDRDRQAKTAMALLSLYMVAHEEDRNRLRNAPPAQLVSMAASVAPGYEPSPAPRGSLTGSFDQSLDAEALGLGPIIDAVCAQPSNAPALFEQMAERREGATGGHLAFTQSSPGLAELISQLLPDTASTVLDPACGEGRLLLAVAQRRPGVEVKGTELLVPVSAVAAQRLLVNGVRPRIQAADALVDDPFSGQLFDAVVCEPPYGTRTKPRDELALTFRGALGASTDMQWLLHCLFKTRHGGMTIVAQPAGTLSREGSDAVLRNELVRHGYLRALISLPTGLAESGAAPLVLWVLTPPTENCRPQNVLFADLTWLPGGAQLDLKALTGEVFPDVVADYQRWSQSPEDFDGSPGVTTAVPVLDLLDASAPLSPQYWVARADRLRGRDAWTARRDQALSDLHGAVWGVEMTEPPDDVPALEMGEPPHFVPLRTLAEAGRVEIIRGEPVEKSELDVEGAREGSPVLTAASLTDGRHQLMPTGYLAAPLTTLTRPGDVVFLPRGRRLRAVVDEKGGHSVAAPLMIVRPVEGDQGMSSRVLAALLSSARVQSLAGGSTLPSVTPKSVTLPRLDPATAAIAAAYLEFLDNLHWQARYLLDQIEETRSVLVEGLETGAVAPRPQDHDHN